MADINATQMRDALAWATTEPEVETSDNPFVWFWEAIEGDFNEDRSTSQILVDAGISMIPLVDQACDARDLIANCKKLTQDPKDQWAWVALGLTLIGLFPTLGSLVKGVLKIFFGFVRRAGMNQLIRAVDNAMSWVISFLRRREVQKYIGDNKIDEIFIWLAKEVKAIKAKVNIKELLSAFDDGLNIMQTLVNKVKYVPKIGRKAKDALEMMKAIRLKADAPLNKALSPILETLDAIIKRLEFENMLTRRAIVDTHNIHFRGEMPRPAAIRMMKEEPSPAWLSNAGEKKFEALNVKSNNLKVSRGVKEGYPNISEETMETFHRLAKYEVKGPARLYRVVAPNSRAMSESWMTEETFNALQQAAKPKNAWRRFLAVWPHWNVDGQFVIYDIKAGESLKTWKGPAASQVEKDLSGKYLEGGWEQVVFNLKGGYADPFNDTMAFINKQDTSIKLSYDEFNALSKAEKVNYQQFREKINHPNITGPFETGWGYTEIDGAGYADKIGVPMLVGQTTKLNNGK